MAITTLCAVVAALRVLPNRAQFFQYESVTLSCEQQGNSSEWRVKRNTTQKNTKLSKLWDRRNGSHCFIDDLYPSDTAVYWCESAAGECSEAVSITVTAGPVILESPALPVMEGEAVTLHCRNRKTSSSNLKADFYKDGLLIGSSSTGNMTLHSVSKSDEGLYKCNISGAGQSPDSWLTVRGEITIRPEPPHSPLTSVLLPVVVAFLSLVSLMVLCLWRSHKGKADRDVSYTDVIITQEDQPNRIRDVDAAPTFYSAVKPGTTIPVLKCTYSNCTE